MWLPVSLSRVSASERHGAHGHVLDRDDLARALLHLVLQQAALVLQEVAGQLQLDVVVHAGHHDGRVDRLGDVVDGAHVQAGLLVVGRAHGGEEDHRDVAGLGVGRSWRMTS
jgi:hypothetical protein